MQSRANRIAVVGVGNELMKDEGVGVHAVRVLDEKLYGLRSDVRCIEAGTSPDWDQLIDGEERLIIIDALKGGGEPGTTYIFTAEQVTSGTELVSSLHHLGVLEGLKISALAGNMRTDVTFIGVEPAVISIGLELSQEVRQRMPEIIRIVLGEIERSPEG